MFANNPMWRNETQGSYFLLFNAMLNFDRRAPAGPPSSQPKGAVPRGAQGGKGMGQAFGPALPNCGQFR
jgi:hypothetical protein